MLPPPLDQYANEFLAYLRERSALRVWLYAVVILAAPYLVWRMM